MSAEARSGAHTVAVRGDYHLPQSKKIEVQKGESMEISFAPGPRPSGIEVRAVDQDGDAVVAEVSAKSRR